MGLDSDERQQLDRIEKKLDKLIPEIRDVSKHLAEAKKLANKGKLPRQQPKKKDDYDKIKPCHLCQLHPCKEESNVDCKKFKLDRKKLLPAEGGIIH